MQVDGFSTMHKGWYQHSQIDQGTTKMDSV